MSKPPQDEMPSLVLDKKPPPVAKIRKNTLPPYSGLLLIVAVVIALAIGYGVYRDSHPDVTADPAETSNTVPAR